jgi:isochorismate pyruvate lyase
MMHDTPPSPNDCRSLDDVLGGVDAIDRQILLLLSQRFELMREAAMLDPLSDSFDGDAHRNRVISHVRRAAFEMGVPVGLVGDFWDRLVDASIATERQARARSA